VQNFQNFQIFLTDAPLQGPGFMDDRFSPRLDPGGYPSGPVISEGLQRALEADFAQVWPEVWPVSVCHLDARRYAGHTAEGVPPRHQPDELREQRERGETETRADAPPLSLEPGFARWSCRHPANTDCHT